MKELLTSKGWYMYYSCNCDGSYREFYNHQKYPGYDIRIRPKKQTFSILQNNHLIAGPTWGYNLQKTLQQHGIAD
jgi:hypothetical protein